MLPYNQKLSARDVLFYNPSLRVTDEINEVITLSALSNLSLGRVTARLIVKLALEEDATGVVDRSYLLLAEATARKAHLVDASIVCLAIGGDDVGRDVLSNESSTLNHSVVANMYPLVYCRMATDDYPVANLNLASQR